MTAAPRTSAKTPGWRRSQRLLSLALIWIGMMGALCPLPGCALDGKLVIVLDLPVTGQGLNPMEDKRLDHFSLVVLGGDGTVETINNAPFDSDGQSFSIGQVPVGDLGGLTLIGYSSLNQVLAYGQAGAFTTDAAGTVRVNVSLRKPFTYVAGGSQVLAFDNTRSDIDDTQSPLPATGGETTDIACTPDGLFLLVSVADVTNPVPTVQPSLKLFTTAGHQPGKEIPLVFKPGYVSLSPDGRWAVVAEYRSEDLSTPTEPARLVAIVDVPAALAAPDPSQTVRTMNITNASRVAFVRDRNGDDLAVVLGDALPPDYGCADGAPPSVLTTIRLDTAQVEGEPSELADPARDVTSDPRDYRVFVADPCSNRLIQYDADSQTVSGYPWTFEGVTSTPKDLAPYSVLISGTRLWVGLLDDVGLASTDPAQTYVAEIEGWTVPGQSTTRILSVPFPNEAVVLGTTGGSGGVRLLVDLQPYTVRPYRLSVPPGEGRISALVLAGYYTSEVTLDDGSGTQVIIPPMEFLSASYLSLDTGSASIRRRYRAMCLAAVYRTPDTPEYYHCQQLASFEQADPTALFIPRGVTSIYGVP